jgi:DNA invertase Pin-like site-specific DNA recombinase
MTKSVAIYSTAGAPGLKRLRMHAEEQGWHIVADLCDDVTTSSRSGAGFSYLVKLISRGSAQIVLAETLLGIGAKVDDLLSLAHALKGSRAALYLLDDGIDTSAASGAAWLDTLASLASYRTQKRRAAATAGQVRARKAGVKWGRPRLAEATIRRVQVALASRQQSLRSIAKSEAISVGRVALEKRRMLEAGLLSVP